MNIISGLVFSEVGILYYTVISFYFHVLLFKFSGQCLIKLDTYLLTINRSV